MSELFRRSGAVGTITRPPSEVTRAANEAASSTSTLRQPVGLYVRYFCRKLEEASAAARFLEDVVLDAET